MSFLSTHTFKMLGFVNKLTSTQSYKYIRLFSNKEIGFIKPLTNQDLLLVKLRNAANTHNLLDIISSHHKIMNNNHVIQALRTIFALQKSGDQSASSKEIITHPNFKTLCVSLKSQVRAIELNELVETLKILSYVGVPSNSTIIQVILQMIRQNINQLSLQQIIFMDFLLKQFDSTPLRDALLIAFPILFEVQLKMKADTDNLSQLTDLLQYATKNKLSDVSVNYLLEGISKHKHVNIKAAISIVWSICELKQDESFEPLLNKMLKIMVQHKNEIQIYELETVLTKLILKYNKKYQFYFNEEFYKTVAEHVIINDLGFNQGLWILQKFSKVGYSHNGLLDYISTKCHSDITLISKTNSWVLYNLVTGFSNTEYRPIHWESVKQGILENRNIFDGKRSLSWIKFALRLAMLDIFIPEVLEKSLNEEYVAMILQDGSHVNSEYFLTLYQTIATIKQEFSHILPNISFVKKAMNELYLPLELNSRPLKAALEHGFGGKASILTNVTTQLGHLLHHVIVMRKGGYPVSFNTEEEKYPLLLEELQIPADSQTIIIIGCDATYYKLDTNILRSIYPLQFKTLEASGYTVVPVCLEVWTNLMDYEKIPYLMQLVKEKTSVDLHLSTTEMSI